MSKKYHMVEEVAFSHGALSLGGGLEIEEGLKCEQGLVHLTL
jgi:hypothetical protein